MSYDYFLYKKNGVIRPLNKRNKEGSGVGLTLFFIFFVIFFILKFFIKFAHFSYMILFLNIMIVFLMNINDFF